MLEFVLTDLAYVRPVQPPSLQVSRGTCGNTRVFALRRGVRTVLLVLRQPDLVVPSRLKHYRQ